MTELDARLAAAETPDDAFAALEALTKEIVDAKLFTIMVIDTRENLARRAYSSDPEHYPAGGTKPVTPNRWLDHVQVAGRTFVANTLKEIDEVFPDAELIGRLGCASVVNLPLLEDGALVTTMNILHGAGYFTPDRVTAIEAELADPLRRVYARAKALGPLL